MRKLLMMAPLILVAGCSDRSQPPPKRIENGAESTHVAASHPTSESSDPWIGHRYSGFRDSVADYGGDTIVVADSVFRVEYVGVREQHLLWLSRGQGRGPTGAAEWTVLVALPISIVGDERVFLHDCRLNGKQDPRIIALGLWDDLPWFTRIHRAWRPNTAARSFDEIRIAGIDCKNTDRRE